MGEEGIDCGIQLFDCHTDSVKPNVLGSGGQAAIELFKTTHECNLICIALGLA